MKLTKIIIALSFASLSLSSLGQGILEQAKQRNKEAKYGEAIKLLSPYVETHKDIYSLWLYGQTLHLAKKYRSAQKIYGEAVQKFPNNTYLKLDYATKLAETQKFKKAIEILKPFAAHKGEIQFFATKELARIYLWEGKYDLAKETIDKALVFNFSDKDALKIAKEIATAQKNWVGMDVSNFSDDQPQKRFSPQAYAGFYINDMLSVGMVADLISYNADNITSSKIGGGAFANFNLHTIKAKSKIELGIGKLPSGESAINASFLFSKRLTKCLEFEFSTSYSPYLLTNISLEDKLMNTQYGGALVLNHPLGFNGRLLYDVSNFPSEENGYITNGYITKGGWLLSPKLKVSLFELSVGYGYSYSDSKESNFVSEKSLSHILTNWTPTLTIDGYYNPFFTPINQTIHSIIGVLGVNITDQIKFGTTVSYGFNSSTDNPYLYLDKNNNSETIIATRYDNMDFSPFIVDVNIAYQVLSDLSINGYYKYQKANFYKSNLVGLKINYLF